MRRAAIKVILALASAGLLAGCGFQLRGQAQLPFDTAYVDAAAGSGLGEALRQSLASQNKLATKRETAAVNIRISHELNRKDILSLSGGGKVREYRLHYQAEIAVFAKDGAELIAPAQLLLTREFSYNDDQVLAKESEEAALNRAMQQDALRQVLRRLSYLKR